MGAEADRSIQPVDREQPPRLGFPVVGIGASAGGLEAFTEFFQVMPADCGMAFVLIQHLPPDRESLIAEILSRHTRMTVQQITEGVQVLPGNVYVIRPGHTVSIRNGLLHLGERLERPGNNRPVDDFFKSLAEEQRERSIAIIMSGMGSNGTAGTQAIKVVGGLCIAQDPETAQFPSMPRHLIDAGYADFVLRIAEMPEMLLNYVKQPYVRGGEEEAGLKEDHQHVREVLAILRTRTRQDFSGYKKPTLLRRIQRRMGLNHVSRLSEYVRMLRQSTTEVGSLADDLLIHVTGFFRDAAAWESLRTSVIVPMVAHHEPNTDIRCWVTACSSGEEAYTLTMLVLEEAERIRKPLDIKVFATDMAERTLSNARNGIYPGGIESEITPERLARFFVKEDAVYRVRPELRQAVVFAPQNILQDPPFSRLDLVTCRNLLIYLEPSVQKRLLSMLHFGLRQGGALFLGTSETAADLDNLFEIIDKRSKIYRRIGPTRHGLMNFPMPSRTSVLSEGFRSASKPTLAQLTNVALLAHHVPAAVTVDRDFRVVYFHGNTRPYFDQPTGEPSRDILVIAQESVRGALRTALQRAMAENKTVTVLDGWTGSEEKRCRVAITVSPLESKSASDYFVVSFDQRPEPAPVLPAAEQKPATDAGIAEELQRVRDELQSTIEELQTSNEEHRASAEEVMSMNEEMQSTNEELETSREEMQSLNEELTTVNNQLQAKMEEYQAISSDLSSLLSSTDIAVLFLDPEFGIRRFTPAVKDLVEMLATDVGRPLSDLAWKFQDPDLMSQARAVMEKLIPIEKEIPGGSGRWYLRRILPYRTADNRIDGLVITFVDITQRRKMEALLAEKARLLDLSNDVIVVRDMDNRVIYWNHGAAELFGWTAEEAHGKDIARLLRTEGEKPLNELVTHLRECDRMVGEVSQTTREGKRVDTLCRWTLDRDDAERPVAILTTATDITDRKAAEAAVRQGEQQFRLLIESVRDFAIFMTDPQGVITTWNPAAERLLGWTEAEAIGKSSAMIFTPEDRQAGGFEQELLEAARIGRAADERWHVMREGRRFWGSGVMAAILDPANQLRGFVKILRDETARKRSEEALVEAKGAAEAANRMKDEFLASLSHELRTPLSAILLWVKLLHGRMIEPSQLEEGLNTIKKSAEAQKTLIDDLLDTSRIISGKLRLQTREVNLIALVQEAIETVLPAVTAKGLTLTAELGADVGIVFVDADRIRQVVWNLLTNAVKFSPAGAAISVSVQRTRQRVQIEVSDTGSGISEEFLPHVFDRFRQADASSTRRQGGLGLGLNISKQLVELHGGSIDARSDGEGRGATFTVHLPVGKARGGRGSAMVTPAGGGETQASKSRLDGVRVLLVEDEVETRKALSIFLRRAGAEVIFAESAAAAFKAFGEVLPGLIVSDIGLPDENGYSLMERIRRHERLAGIAPVPAVALSAFTRDEDKLSAITAGFDRHLSKPIDPEHLIEALCAVVRTGGGE